MRDAVILDAEYQEISLLQYINIIWNKNFLHIFYIFSEIIYKYSVEENRFMNEEV